jgi:hypothetical protein
VGSLRIIGNIRVGQVLAAITGIAALAALDTDPNPSLGRWHYVEDPQAETPLAGMKYGSGVLRRMDPRWVWNGVALFVVAIALLLVVVMF